jgi:serine/threonine protein kinase
MDSPLASRLIGKQLGNWKVTEKRMKDASDNSGFFSTCYTVEGSDGGKAFLKAYNYQYAFQARTGSADVLRFMTENYTYERDLLKFCNEMGMKRVVTAVDSGEYYEENETLSVPYLIFEIAHGSLKTIDYLEHPDLEWKLKAFHGALVGLSQLHSKKVVHQDIKPSNILVFGEDYSKISDLGSATQKDKCSNWDKPHHVGDMRYAPIELLYSYCSMDWNARKYGADLYMMGGILAFMLSGVNILAAILSKLPISLRPDKYTGSWQDIVPVLIDANYQALADLKQDIPPEIADEMMDVLNELLNPIPEDRGNHPQVRERVGQYSLIRYIAKIDRMSKTAMWVRKKC